MFSKKLVMVPIFVALVVSMSACGDSHSTDNANKTGSRTTTKTDNTSAQTDDSLDSTSGGMGMTYSGKMGIDMGGGMVMPMSGGMPQMGLGF